MNILIWYPPARSPASCTRRRAARPSRGPTPCTVHVCVYIYCICVWVNYMGDGLVDAHAHNWSRKQQRKDAHLHFGRARKVGLDLHMYVCMCNHDEGIATNHPHHHNTTTAPPPPSLTHTHTRRHTPHLHRPRIPHRHPPALRRREPPPVGRPLHQVPRVLVDLAHELPSGSGGGVVVVVVVVAEGVLIFCCGGMDGWVDRSIGRHG